VHFFLNGGKAAYFPAGAGLDARLRFIHDERSEAASSAEPIITAALYANYKRLSLSLPLWTRFYSNGIYFTMLPELSCRIGRRFSVFFRYELSYLTLYKVSSHQFHQDRFIGNSFLL
jgi:hypothetical protein